MHLLYVSYANEHTRVTWPNIDYCLIFKNGFFEKWNLGFAPLIFFRKKVFASLIFFERSLRLPTFFRKKSLRPLFFLEKKSSSPCRYGPGPGTRWILTRPLHTFSGHFFQGTFSGHFFMTNHGDRHETIICCCWIVDIFTSKIVHNT